MGLVFCICHCYGGVIILGVVENKDGSWHTTGLKAADKEKLIKQFWDTINNRKKVSANILKDDDVEIYDVNGDLIIVIHVPMAKREEKPVYVNNDLFGATFRRNHEGDYRCTRLQVKQCFVIRLKILWIWRYWTRSRWRI